MNGIEKITARIQADADSEIAVIRERAQEEVEAIRTSSAREADAVSRSILERGAVKAKEKEDGLISMAQMEAKKTVLAAKQEMLDKAFDMALAQLLAMPSDQKAEMLAKLAADAAVSGAEEIILSAQDKAEIGEQVVAAANEKRAAAGKNAALSLSAKAAEIEGGLILKDDKVEINCAFDTLIRLNKKEIAGQVAKVLF